MTGSPTQRLPAIDPARCTGCGRCVAVCPPHVLSLHRVRWDKRAALDDAPGCTSCAACAVACPFHAITMHRQGTAAATPHTKPPPPGGPTTGSPATG